jgi:integrase
MSDAPSSRIPGYCKHKATGQAVVRLNGKDHYLGMYGTAESRLEYARLIKEWEVNGRRLPSASPTDLTVNELLAAYWDFVKGYYVKEGEPTSEQDTTRQALRFVKQLYGHTLATEFGPLALKTVRQAMIDHKITRTKVVIEPGTCKARKETLLLRTGLARQYINKQVGRIKRMFSWAVENELLPAAVYHALAEVKGLRKDRSRAREKERVRPVAEEVVTSTLPHLPPMVADMVRLQLLTGSRPGEVVLLRACDLDMTGPVWEYRPGRHKSEHHDRERIIFLGPQAQGIVRRYLTLNTAAYLFCPKSSERQRNSQRREKATRPRKKLRRRQRRRRAPGDRYDVAAYRRAIRRACEKAGLPLWHPNQLRHSAGTSIRKRFGLEASQAVLGHAELSVTQVYSERDLEAARTIMAQIG